MARSFGGRSSFGGGPTIGVGGPTGGASCWADTRTAGGGWVRSSTVVLIPSPWRIIWNAGSDGSIDSGFGGSAATGGPRRARSSAGGGSDADLVAQFPGKVRKILVKADQAVAEGDPLVLVEAMKMEFAVKAPFAGKVTKLLVKEGQQLSPGDRLLDMEASGGS